MMTPMEFHGFLAEARRLTPHQRQVLMDDLRPLAAREESVRIVEARIGSAPVCPHCGHSVAVRYGVVSGLQRYRCKDCGRCFNALTGTPLARLRHKEKWLGVVQEMVEGTSVRKAAAHLAVHRNTAFLWRHRFLELPREQRASLLTGIAEADETYFLESHKGQKRDLNRPARKRGGKARRRGLSAEQVPVLVCRDRGGQEADFVLEKDDQAHLSAVLKPILSPDAVLCTDGSGTLAATARKLGVTHRPINLAAGQRVIAGVYHVQNVNAYDSRLKEWMRRFHGVATRYLPNYLGWRRFLDQAKDAPLPANFLEAALGIRVHTPTVT